MKLVVNIIIMNYIIYEFLHDCLISYHRPTDKEAIYQGLNPLLPCSVYCSLAMSSLITHRWLQKCSAIKASLSNQAHIPLLIYPFLEFSRIFFYVIDIDALIITTNIIIIIVYHYYLQDKCK